MEKSTSARVCVKAHGGSLVSGLGPIRVRWYRPRLLHALSMAGDTPAMRRIGPSRPRAVGHATVRSANMPDINI